MKKERNKNIIIVGLVITTIIFAILLLLILTYFYPKIMEIEDKKVEVENLLKEYNYLNTKGLPYTEFKKIKDPKTSLYQQKILAKIDKNFYEKNFLNNSNKYPSFLDFLSSLEKQINWDLKEDYDKKHDKIYNVLPIYSDSSDEVKTGLLSDFKFINMIENLLYDYDLMSESPLWIKKIEKLKNYTETENKSDLSSDIYVIELPLDIEWKKKNIIDFLKYIKTMWNIEICTKENVKKWEYGCKYEDQLIINNPTIFTELNSISMDKYIDSSPYISMEDKDEDLLDILTKTPQRNERFNMEIDLLFYVQWLPNYKIKESISNVILKLPKNLSEKDLQKLSRINFYSIKDRLKKLQIKYKNNKLISQQLNELDWYMKSIEKDIRSISKSLNKSEDLMSTYNKVEKYKWIFSLISDKLDEIESKAKN